VAPVVQSNNTSDNEVLSNCVYFKVHRRDKTEILAICDESLIGKELFNEKARMRISADFYCGKKISPSDALELIKNYMNINVVGSVLELGIRKKILNKDAIIWFNTEDGKKIPHLLIFSIPPI
jgi:hypothetical protein